MNNICSAIKMANTLTPKGIKYPDELLVKHDCASPFDMENLGYLTGGIDNNNGYFPWLTLLAAHSDSKTIVELGNRYGSSTIALYHGLKPDQILFTVDIIKDQRYIPDVIFKDERVKFIFGDALDLSCYRSSKAQIPFDIDILWTDTVHTEAQVSAEFYVYEPLLADEALIVIDDININDKRRFFDLADFEKYDLTHICHGSGFGAIRYVRKDSERHMSKDERIMESLFRASQILSKRYWDIYSEVSIPFKKQLISKVASKLKSMIGLG